MKNLESPMSDTADSTVIDLHLFSDVDSSSPSITYTPKVSYYIGFHHHTIWKSQEEFYIKAIYLLRVFLKLGQSIFGMVALAISSQSDILLTNLIRLYVAFQLSLVLFFPLYFAVPKLKSTIQIKKNFRDYLERTRAPLRFFIDVIFLCLATAGVVLIVLHKPETVIKETPYLFAALLLYISFQILTLSTPIVLLFFGYSALVIDKHLALNEQHIADKKSQSYASTENVILGTCQINTGKILYSVKKVPQPLLEQINQHDNNTTEIQIYSGDANCPICLLDYKKDDVLSQLNCQHHFHHQCIVDRLVVGLQCPLCVNEQDTVDIGIIPANKT
ncbi:hypothetical protein BC833DRAFT_296897 [Globomyces pollinis-pini]|nr:hypothetical protein BC833DRAFT_296897 [Globomyces pollinis-pini]